LQWFAPASSEDLRCFAIICSDFVRASCFKPVNDCRIVSKRLKTALFIAFLWCRIEASEKKPALFGQESGAGYFGAEAESSLYRVDTKRGVTKRFCHDWENGAERETAITKVKSTPPFCPDWHAEV
jgi:NAD dependent epimerase/dehydratase family enzyme